MTAFLEKWVTLVVPDISHPVERLTPFLRFHSVEVASGGPARQSPEHQMLVEVDGKSIASDRDRPVH